MAATAAIYREAGSRWMLFTLGWTTGLAYAAATVFYQLARFEQHPATSIGWVLGIATAMTLTLFMLRQIGKQTLHEVAI